MRKTVAILVLSLSCMCLSAKQDRPWNEGINIIPAPVEMDILSGSFKLSSAKAIYAPGVEKIASFFSDRIEASTGLRIPVSTRKGNIRLILDESLDVPNEGYELRISHKEVELKSSTPAGLFYGMQTVMQLLPAEVDSRIKVKGVDWKVPCVSIVDYPRFAWRGFHVDPCRHFMTVEDTKKQIDMLSEYKVNVMHWHLTDDQGWRIQIQKYPKLTEVGGFRTEFDGTVHGGYYTQDEIRDVVAYAAERYVTIVPEIEMPGHCVAAIRAYPELSCEQKPVGTFYTWGSPDIVFCPGNDTVFDFLEDVVSEVTALFPGEYFHIGGDECLKTKWEVCDRCQARIAAEGFVTDKESTAVEKLQSYAVKRMEKILAKYGKKLVGWDEILEGGLSPNATVMSWRGEKGGITSAIQGHNVVMTPSHDGLYLDHYQGDPKIEPVTIGRYTTLEKIYKYDPVPHVLDSLGLSQRVIGVQANTWSEYLYDEAQREYMMYPRAFALAEIAWTPAERKDWDDFSRRIDNACVRLDCHGLNYHIPLPEQPGGSCDHLAFIDSLEVSFTTTRPEAMVYSLNGEDPDQTSSRYVGPFVFHDDAILKIRTILASGKMSKVRTIEIRKQDMLPATSVDGLVPGLDLHITYGEFSTVSEFRNAPEGARRKTVTIRELKEIPLQEEWRRDMQNIVFYGAEAAGYMMVPRDGVYRFSTDNDQLWIDGKLVVDNDGEVKRYSRHDTEIALKAGLHPVRIIFLSNVGGGWTTARNNASVTVKGPGDVDFHSVVFYR